MTKEEFLKDVADWDSHRLLLWPALEETKDSKYPVVEFGSGDGSTFFIRKYCADSGREFKTYESDREWAKKTGSTLIDNWRTADIYERFSVALVDNAPGELRLEIIAILKDRADIIVVHDSEEPGYELDKIYPLFKYRYDCKVFNTWATALSNLIDVSSWEI